MIKIFTIGFTKKKAKYFFDLLKSHDVRSILDVRLNNVSQLAGFSKKDDLEYFAKQLCDASYNHVKELAPTKDILDDYKKKRTSWQTYERQFNELLAERKIEEKLDPQLIHDGCLLCSEDKPHFCHRRLVADYLSEKWEDVSVTHLE